MLNFRVARPDHLIDLNDLAELDYVRISDGVIEIGAMTRHQRLATDPQIRAALPLLAQGAASIGHYAIRQRGTLGGSLAHADPAAQLPLLAVLLDAELMCRSVARQREVPAADFFQSIMTTALEPDEVIVGVRFPVIAPPVGWGFEIFNQRQGDFALVAVAALLELNSKKLVCGLKLAIGGVSVKPVRFDDITARYLGREPDAKWLGSLADIVQSVCEIEETRISAIFRQELVHVLTQRACTAALKGAWEALRT